MHFDPSVWGPHYWFFIHTVAESYPITPNSVTKRKYYDFIQNIPLFIPVPEMGDKFSELLDKYPVTPYLDNRDSFVRWTHFIHNKYNFMLGKEEISLPNALEKYRAEYKPKPVYLSEKIKTRKHVIYALLVLTLLILIYFNYK
uniref:thiol oxidase n=1 Tax=viral metagenome TaxID=1070528 RepID=A0A6C0JHE4_9ZZZZ